MSTFFKNSSLCRILYNWEYDVYLRKNTNEKLIYLFYSYLKNIFEIENKDYHVKIINTG